jgi:hypothetical protein
MRRHPALLAIDHFLQVYRASSLQVLSAMAPLLGVAAKMVPSAIKKSIVAWKNITGRFRILSAQLFQMLHNT